MQVQVNTDKDFMGFGHIKIPFGTEIEITGVLIT